MTDPAPFLSTIITATAALVAIIGGLLVARFVSLDSEERGSRKILADAADRLALARSRAQSAWQDVLRWEAGKFFRSRTVMKAVVDDGVTSAPIRASCVKRAWVIGLAALTVSPGWA
jgi:hypothetical protein